MQTAVINEVRVLNISIIWLIKCSSVLEHVRVNWKELQQLKTSTARILNQ